MEKRIIIDSINEEGTIFADKDEDLSGAKFIICAYEDNAYLLAHIFETDEWSWVDLDEPRVCDPKHDTIMSAIRESDNDYGVAHYAFDSFTELTGWLWRTYR